MTSVSVIVAVFGRERLAQATLESLSDQSYTGDYEVIVCDDGTSPPLVGGLAEIAAGFRNIRYVWQPNKGYRLGRSRNNGIRLAQGDIVLFLDGDLLLPQTLIESHVREHDSVGASAVIAGSRRWISPRVLAGRRLAEARAACERYAVRVDTATQVRLFDSRLPWMACWGFNVSVPRSTHLVFDEQMGGYGHEDYELWCRLCHRHHWEARLSVDLDVFHLAEPDKSDEWNPWHGAEPEAIEAYVRNCLYLRRKHHDLDIDDAMWPLGRFVRDRASGRWRRALRDEARPLAAAIAEAEAWALTEGRSEPREGGE